MRKVNDSSYKNFLIYLVKRLLLDNVKENFIHEVYLRILLCMIKMIK